MALNEWRLAGKRLFLNTQLIPKVLEDLFHRDTDLRGSFFPVPHWFSGPSLPVLPRLCLTVFSRQLFMNSDHNAFLRDSSQLEIHRKMDACTGCGLGYIHHKFPGIGLDKRRDKVVAAQAGAEAVENPVHKS